MSAEQTPDIERVLAEHTYVPSGLRGVSRCACGVQFHGMPHHHRAHVAQALAPVLAAAVREAEQRAWERGREDMRRQSVAVMTEGPQPVLRNPYRADCIEVHWGDVDSRPTSLHGNGAKALGRVTLDVAKVTCRLCLALLSDRADRITEPVSHEAATSGEEASKA